MMDPHNLTLINSIHAARHLYASMEHVHRGPDLHPDYDLVLITEAERDRLDADPAVAAHQAGTGYYQGRLYLAGLPTTTVDAATIGERGRLSIGARK